MMKKKSLLLSALALSMGLTMLSAPFANAALPPIVAGQNVPSLAPMLEKVLPAVVSVHVEGMQNAKPTPAAKGGERQFEGLGSGVIIDAAKGYVLTNNHVISNATTIKVQLNDGREYAAKLIGRDEQSDIALIQLTDAKNLTAIKVADSDKLRVGDFAVAVGNPFGIGQTATSGIISALGRSGLNLEGLENFIQTDAAINRGNSGGALINLNGELIGINTAILAPGGGNIGIGFAIPSNMAQSLSAQLIKYGEVKRGVLGIRGREMTADLAQAFKLDAQRGAFVNEVLPNSAAAKAGIKAGDVITALDGNPLSSFAELRAKIGSAAPGTVLKLGLLRNGKPLTVPVTLENSGVTTTQAENISPSLQGATLSDGDVKGTPGIKIDDVAKGSVAAQMGMHKGDLIIGINSERIRDIASLRKALAANPPVIALHLLRNGEGLYLLIR
ncbi:outer membrane stress sensor serine protease [Obesumbacterium proteus ATCC 12841]|uniref:Outer membrane stress sensor serine protease n=2 Tax=Obesumbacterium proteus TaxID=82983 RepID=A0AA91EGJ2_9GAMM|nr:outer membrane stress sensor serine protease [Obesumbacterium proteus ATCC 12841]TBL52165.1 Do family serine endopeptidase [Obesumbacterium proteus]